MPFVALFYNILQSIHHQSLFGLEPLALVSCRLRFMLFNPTYGFIRLTFTLTLHNITISRFCQGFKSFKTIGRGIQFSEILGFRCYTLICRTKLPVATPLPFLPIFHPYTS